MLKRIIFNSLLTSFLSFLLCSLAIGADDYIYPNSSTNGVDPWGFYFRQCTSYVAWCLNRDSQTTSAPYAFFNTMHSVNPNGTNNWGNAYHWDEHAKSLGITVSSQPVVGSVAQWNENEIGGGYGHVAYVEKVYADGTIDVSEYNYKPYAYSTRRIKVEPGTGPRFLYVNASDQTVYNFTNNSTEGWIAGNAISNSTFETGKWVFNTGVDPYVIGPRLAKGINAGQFSKAEVSLSAKGNGRTENAYIYFDTGSGFRNEEKFHLGEVPTQGQSKHYVVNFPADVVRNNSPLQQIRLDPLYNEGLNFTPNDKVKIDFIRLISDYHYWDFQDNSLGWYLNNASSEGFIGSWAWKIQPTSGDPQLISPWLGHINTTDYKSLFLRFAVNCAAPYVHAIDNDGVAPFIPPSGGNAGVDVCLNQTNGELIKLNGNVYFDLTAADEIGFTAQSPTVGFTVKPTGAQTEYLIQIPTQTSCSNIYQVRVDFFEDRGNNEHLVYVDKIEFRTGGAVAQTESLLPSTQLFAADGASSDLSFITILPINDLAVANNTPISIKASAFGCCSEEYNWSLPTNPFGLSIDNEGNISGNSGSVNGTYTTKAKAEDRYDANNFAELSFNVTVNTDPNSSSIRVYNDGTLPLNLTRISKENNSPWLHLEVPTTLPTIAQGSYQDIFISADRQSLPIGNYNENIVILSNDSDNPQVIVPVSLNVNTDNSAPSAPQNISASPSTWFGIGSVAINWDNPLPEDPSGISGVYYKIGSPPLSNSDGVFDTNKPALITPVSEGIQTIYLWLVDGNGNADYQNINSTVFLFDKTSPSIISKYPDNGQTDIPVDSGIFLNLEDNYSGIDLSTIAMKVNGSIVTPVITGTQNNFSISYQPVTPFDYGTTVIVTVTASDISAPVNAMAPVSWSFSTLAQASTPVINYFYLNEGDNSTISSAVILYNNTSGSPIEYMASELADFSDAAWQTYSVVPSFSLSHGSGAKTVYLKVRNDAGESTVVSDTILLEDSTRYCDLFEVTAGSGSTIYTPSASTYQYHYGPSIILTGDNLDIWTCSPDPSDAWDRIEHRRGTINTNGSVQWSTNWVSALERTPNSRDKYSACDPSVFAHNNFYYIGYTSTDQEAGGGATSNDVFVARCNRLPNGAPDVSCEKWNGGGWGGLPQPIIEYNGPNWGVGQPSFVVKDETLYIYYTDGGTKVATADITNPNWPLTMDFSAPPILINDREQLVLGGKPGPIDVKYIDDLNRFIAVGVSFEFNPLSNVFVYESLNGIDFTPVVTSRNYWPLGILQDRAHNIGLSGDHQGHLQLSNTNFIAYSYGRPNGDPNATYNANWPTYINPTDIPLCYKGDVNRNSLVDLPDAILALQSSCGANSTLIDKKADVNSDGKISIVEAIFVLRKLSQ